MFKSIFDLASANSQFSEPTDDHAKYLEMVGIDWGSQPYVTAAAEQMRRDPLFLSQADDDEQIVLTLRAEGIICAYREAKQDYEHWTTVDKYLATSLNVAPSLNHAAEKYGAVRKRGKSPTWEFTDAAHANQVCMALGITLLDTPNDRKIILDESQRAYWATCERLPTDKNEDWASWSMPRQHQLWERRLGRVSTQRMPHADVDLYRCLQTPKGHSAGWAAYTPHGWLIKNASSIKMMMQADKHTKSDAEAIMGSHERRPWTIINTPFAPEYGPNRQWNREPIRYAVEPTPGPHPTWDMFHIHIAKQIDGDARAAGYESGLHYIRCWLAASLQRPECHTPYLHIFGPQNTGKSLFHESLKHLVTAGVNVCDRALAHDFNAELEHTLFAVVEERDLSTIRGVGEKIKYLVTSDTLSIRRMRTDTYVCTNYCHWIQTSNDPFSLRVESGDTRVTCIPVLSFEGPEIPKDEMNARLKSEASHILYTLLNMDIPVPKCNGRLAVAPLYSSDKTQIQSVDECPLLSFIKKNPKLLQGRVEAKALGKHLGDLHGTTIHTKTLHKMVVKAKMKYTSLDWTMSGGKTFVEGITL
ncbi:MAG: DUF5906 domain-containing protein [Pirellulaceae bacterium]